MSASRAVWVGVDVGGSAVKLGAIAPDGTQLGTASVPVPEGATASSILSAAGERARELAGGTPTGLGVGLPGLLDRARGVVERSPNLPWLERSPNLPWLEGADVRALLGEASGIAPADVRLENDANVAALGELWLGAGRGEASFVLLTLGTGIGGGVVLDGRLWAGEGMAGEVGHLTVAPDGPRCGCGARGCLETLASASAARRRAEEAGLPEGRPGDLEALAAEARAAAGPARELCEAIGRDLGHGLSLALSLLDVRLFLVGGGFSAALDVLLPGVRVGLSEWSYGERVAGVRVTRAVLGASAGWIGAARLCLTP